MISRALVGVAAVLATVSACGDPLEPRAIPPFGLVLAYHVPRLGEDPIAQFVFERDGTLWASTVRGRLLRSDGEAVRDTSVPGPGDGDVRDLFVDGSDRLWVALGDGFAVHDDGEWTRHRAPDLVAPGTSISQVAVNGPGEVLLAVGNAVDGGLLLLSDGVWRELTPQNSDLPGSMALTVDVADDGSFWVAAGGTQGRGGVVRIAGGEIRASFDAGSGLLHDGVAALDAADDRVYLGYARPPFDSGDRRGGLQVLSTGDGAVTSRFPSDTELTSDQVIALALGAEGAVWFATRRYESVPGCGGCVAGIGRLDPTGGFEVLSSLNSDLAPDEHLPWIQVDAAGDVYVLAADRHAIFRIVR